MQQRQLRLGDILDDYCPRERRVTNHAIVAMVGDDVKQTRCATCDAEHEYKHAKVPRPRRKTDAPAALTSQPAPLPKRVVSGAAASPAPPAVADVVPPEPVAALPFQADRSASLDGNHDQPESDDAVEPADTEGPVHRRLIRAALPRHEGQQSQVRSVPDFTIRQPSGGRPNRFRPRPGRGHQAFAGNRSGQPGGGQGGRPGGQGGPMRSGSTGHGGRPPKPHHSGRKGPK